MAKKKLTREELISILKETERESQDIKPLPVRELFPQTPTDDMTSKTETMPRMVSHLVRMRVLEAALDTTRTESLIAIFIREYDRRMISLNRKGRLEMLGALQSLAESSGGEDINL